MPGAAGSPQRAYRAACPNCGAPVDFRSAASALAVCSFCRSTLVREGEALRRIGQSAELFDDHSPLQIGSAGRWQGAAFTLVGRLQLRYAGGVWNEWHALFDSGKSGWLSEDNGRHVMAFDVPAGAPVPTGDGARSDAGSRPADSLPPAASLRVGAAVLIGGQRWEVASLTRVRVHAAQGELPGGTPTAGEHLRADLRNTSGEVGTLDDADPARPAWSVGREVELADLALSGLTGPAEKTLGARGVECPSCGAAIEVQLASTQSLACPQCRAVVDLSQGIGADLAHYAQDTPGEGAEHAAPLLPLGATGTLALGPGGPRLWQVVGYVERCTIPGTVADDDGEQYFWREYLLYHRVAGFAFVVDAEDGWSWARPITGVPELQADGARYRGEFYRLRERYASRITYVLGEFYWRLERGARTEHADYGGPGGRRLNREQTAAGGDAELTWSSGAPLKAELLLSAFRLGQDRLAALKRDVSPLSSSGGSPIATFFVVLLVLSLMFALARCSDDDDGRCDEARRVYGESSNEFRQCEQARASGGSTRGYGGSYGGFSTGGGGHK